MVFGGFHCFRGVHMFVVFSPLSRLLLRFRGLNVFVVGILIRTLLGMQSDRLCIWLTTVLKRDSFFTGNWF